MEHCIPVTAWEALEVCQVEEEDRGADFQAGSADTHTFPVSFRFNIS